jgi:hypothetical protein
MARNGALVDPMIMNWLLKLHHNGVSIGFILLGLSRLEL